VSWIHGAAARIRLAFGRRVTEDRIDAELEFHVDMETQRIVREQGLDVVEARRRALATFGGMQTHREALRHGRGTAWFGALKLDTMLAIRMLAKYPALTLVGVLGVSVAVAVGTLAFIVAQALNVASLPVDEGERIVAINNRDLEKSQDVKSTHLQSVTVWREMRTVTDLAGYRLAQRNLIAGDRAPVSKLVAEMTASGFRLARVTPKLGRTFTDDDERDGSPNVVVIGYDLWQQLFDGREDIVGSIVQLGATSHSVIGVMPPGFRYPFNNQVWIPLRLNPLTYPPGRAPSLTVFGRLAPGASLEDAQRELTTIAPRVNEILTAKFPSIRPLVVPYTRAFFNGTVGGMGYGSLAQRAQIIVILLLVVITTNLAVLVYARTASRAGEIAVRTALGASRQRIVAQLFVEALALSGVAAIVGLLMAYAASQRAASILSVTFGEQLPYWIRLDITPNVALYTAGLAILASVIIGAIPALKATRPQLANTLKNVSGTTSARLGRTWTALLVAEVAVSVAVLPIAQGGTRAWVGLALADFGSPILSHTVIATALLDEDARAIALTAEARAARLARYASRVSELERRLETEAGYDVTLMSAAPGAENNIRIEVDMIAGAPDSLDWSYGPSVLSTEVGPDFFGAFGIRLLAGRLLETSGADERTNAVVVNSAFVQRFFNGRNALGRRIRRFAEVAQDAPKESREPWWEVVGVVDNFPVVPSRTSLPKVYLPLRAAETFPMTLAVRAASVPASTAADRVRSTALAVDPSLRFTPIRSIEDLIESGMEGERLGILALVMVTMSVVLLSAAGIYALMSFTVMQRRREIGIRSALGAGRSRVLLGILSRALWQIGLGVGIGVIGAPTIATLAGDSSTTKELVVNGLALIASMFVVGLLATFGPARRALNVHPTEALRAE
jgi:predicted permease